MHWCIHLGPIPHGPNIQALRGVRLVPLKVQIYVLYMKTKKLENVLDLDNVQVHRFLAL